MRDLGSSKGERPGIADADLLEELGSSRRRVRELERNLAERELQEAADQKEVVRLAEAFKPAKIRAWCWTAEARQTQYLPIRGDVRDAQGRHASQVSFSEERLLQSVHPDDRERLASTWDRAYEEHVPYEIEYRLVFTGGEERHNHEIARPEFDESGRYLGHFGTTQDITDRIQAKEALREARNELELRVEERTRDIEEKNETLVHEITERKRAEEVLRDSRDRIRLIADNLPILISYFDNEQRIHFGNKTLDEWYDRSAEEILGRTIQECMGPGGFKRMDARLEAAFAGTPQHYEHTTTYPDGITRTVDALYVPHVDETGTVQGCFAFVQDITERKATEEAMLAIMKEAEIANRTKTEFLANMSHELRTPLNAIIGFSEIIKDESLGPVGNTKYRDYADDINESGHHLLALINDILDLSKVESGTDELHEESIEVSQIARTIIRLIVGLAQKGNVELELDMSGDIAVLHADERKVKQILLNLLSNAIKFTPDGGKVTLKIWSHAESGFVFQVIDTGVGIAFNDIPKALAPFQQIDSGLNRRHEGTGLGLPLTKSLVEMHGGYLDLQSKVGVGTIVTVRFPAERIVEYPRDTGSIDIAAKKVG